MCVAARNGVHQPLYAVPYITVYIHCNFSQPHKPQYDVIQLIKIPLEQLDDWEIHTIALGCTNPIHP